MNYLVAQPETVKKALEVERAKAFVITYQTTDKEGFPTKGRIDLREANHKAIRKLTDLLEVQDAQ